jgi:aspartyl-tRNA(Asn)/glutamyl-tRNA(Gln) amidotransferase subunit C
MKGLDKKQVLHVAKLANLTLSSKEVSIFGKQLSEVVNYVGELKEVNTDGVVPTSQTTGLEDIFRLDTIETKDLLTSEEALSGTEKIHNGYFVVPGLLEKRGKK